MIHVYFTIFLYAIIWHLCSRIPYSCYQKLEIVNFSVCLEDCTCSMVIMTYSKDQNVINRESWLGGGTLKSVRIGFLAGAPDTTYRLIIKSPAQLKRFLVPGTRTRTHHKLQRIHPACLNAELLPSPVGVGFGTRVAKSPTLNPYSIPVK